MNIWVALKECVKSVMKLWRTTEICSKPGFSAGAKEKYQQELQGNLMQKSYLLGLTTWKVMQRNVWTDLVNLRVEQLNNKNKVANCQKSAHKIVLKFLYLARIGGLDMLWSVNKLARAVTKWTKACDKHLARLISYLHHKLNTDKMLCGKYSTECRLGLFQDSDFALDLEDSKSTSSGTLCNFRKSQFCTD